MFINCNTTKCMTVGTKQKLAFQNEELSLTINSEQLQHSACEKLLGIKIDSNLNWKHQIDQICSKISSRIYLLSKIKKYFNLESCLLLIIAVLLGEFVQMRDLIAILNCKKNSKNDIRSRSHSTT